MVNRFSRHVKKLSCIRNTGVIIIVFSSVFLCGSNPYYAPRKDDLRFNPPAANAPADLKYARAGTPSPSAAVSGPAFTKRSVTIRKGDSFYEVLKRNGVPAGDALNIVKQTKKVFNVASIKPGNSLKLFFHARTGEIARLDYAISGKQTLVVNVADTIKVRKVRGRVQEPLMARPLPVQQTGPQTQASSKTADRTPLSANAKVQTSGNIPADLRQVDVRIRKGEALVDILRRQGLSRAAVNRLAAQVESTYPLATRIRPGHRMHMWFPANQPGDLAQLVYEIDKNSQLEVTSAGAGYSARIAARQEHPRMAAAAPVEVIRAPEPVLEQAPVMVTLTAAQDSTPDPKENAAKQPSLRQVDVTIRKGSLLDDILGKEGMNRADIYRLAAQVKPVYPLARNIKPGHTLRLWLTNDQNNSLARLSYAIDSTSQLLVIADAGGYTARIVAAASQEAPAQGAAVAETACAVPPAHEFTIGSPYAFASLFPEHFEIFAEPRSFDVFAIAQDDEDEEESADTATEAEPEDNDLQAISEPDTKQQDALREQRLKKAERLKRAKLAKKAREARQARLAKKKRKARMERVFLTAPLNYRRISSGFTHCRKHPVLGVERPHLGVDFAASVGTPVRALGRGTVIHKGYSGGYGEAVHVRHPNGYVTYYAHLSRYAKKLRAGQRVDKGDVIGYVGSSGLSTGPHLDFRVSKNGTFINPLKLKNFKEPVVGKSETRLAKKKGSKSKHYASKAKKHKKTAKKRRSRSREIARR